MYTRAPYLYTKCSDLAEGIFAEEGTWKPVYHSTHGVFNFMFDDLLNVILKHWFQAQKNHVE